MTRRQTGAASSTSACPLHRSLPQITCTPAGGCRQACLCPAAHAILASMQRATAAGPMCSPTLYPFMAELIEAETGRHACGGSVIHKRVILTAAHVRARPLRRTLLLLSMPVRPCNRRGPFTLARSFCVSPWPRAVLSWLWNRVFQPASAAGGLQPGGRWGCICRVQRDQLRRGRVVRLPGQKYKRRHAPLPLQGHQHHALCPRHACQK